MKPPTASGHEESKIARDLQHAEVTMKSELFVQTGGQLLGKTPGFPDTSPAADDCTAHRFLPPEAPSRSSSPHLPPPSG
jgi:hypothetical protein